MSPVLLAGDAALAQQPPTKPILRIETGMHTAVIWRIGVDAANRFLVTGSQDKTVRLWELSTGRLIKVIRPPIGEGDEGKIYAVAISPDGKTIAASGWTKAAQNSHNIYLFERESGRLVHRIGGLPNVINHLSFSPDGNRLAASLGVKNGVRIFSTGDWQEVGKDIVYGDTSNGLDFDRAGRLVTTCYDGFLRLYDGQMRLIAKQAGPSGKRPFSVKFSPDGSKIAVGYSDSTKVDVISASNNAGLLKPLFSPDTTGVDNGDWYSAAWSPDGNTLFAGGQYDKSGIYQIRRWSNGGRGSFQDLPASTNTILDLISLTDGGIVFGAFDPSWGVISASGQRTRFVEGEIADFRGFREGFQIDGSGKRIRFAYELNGRLPAEFNLRDRRLEMNPTADSAVIPPRTQTTGIAVEGWRNTYEPKLNGAKLALDQYETSRSLAIAPDAKKVLLGTEWNLRLYDRSGKQLWMVDAPGVTWSVNISGDGRLAVAAFGDGTIRWYRLSDGEEMLAMFPHRDKKRWVMWTPSGYYDASPGGEDLIGWHANQGKDQAADFHPASRFRNLAYRPDVINLILGKLDEAAAVAQANEEIGRRQQQLDIARALPPIVEILSPSGEVRVTRPSLTLRYRIRSQSNAEITGIKIQIDGRPASAGKGQSARPPSAGSTVESEVTLPERDCEVSIIAENAYGTASTPATVRVIWAGGVPTILKPSLYVLAIGVNEDRDPETEKLTYAEKDARDFAAAMKSQEGGIYGKVTTRVLADATATKEQILAGFDWLNNETTSRDVAMVFLSGHGINDGTRYFFMTSNAERSKRLATAVSFLEIKGLVESVPGKVVFFLDTCHSGNALGTAKGPFDLDRVINELASAENGAVVFASSTGRQRSFERDEWKNGAFTKALVEGLYGKADLLDNNRISIETLAVWLTKRVKELTGNQQSPVLLKPGSVPDFPIAIKK
jgi:WD40 repeat protein